MTEPAHQHLQALIGQPGSRQRVPTPALLLDLDAAERNMSRMAERCKAAGLALRPHAKSHKCAAIAQLQRATGAVGHCCAKIGEAEALTAAGVRDILVTSPIAGADLARRAAQLALTDPGFEIVADHPEQVQALALACTETFGSAGGTARQLGVLVDVDVGLARTGVADPQAALAVAQAIAAQPALRLAGVQGYGGQWQHMVGQRKRHTAVADGMVRLRAAVDALRHSGLPVARITGGGTGSFGADAALGLLTEVQPGSFVFMDRQYSDALGADADGEFEQALWVQARVISINARDHVTLDAGLKALATDGPLPMTGPGHFQGCHYAFFGDEHGRLSRPASGAAVRLNDRVELVPPHCDPTVDRYRYLVLVQQDRVMGVVPLEAAQHSA